jgi:hypothetical protein
VIKDYIKSIRGGANGEIYVEIEVPPINPLQSPLRVFSRDVLEYLTSIGEEIIDFIPGYATNSSDLQRTAIFKFTRKINDIEKEAKSDPQSDVQEKKTSILEPYRGLPEPSEEGPLPQLRGSKKIRGKSV